jgi:hypothetical protein
VRVVAVQAGGFDERMPAVSGRDPVRGPRWDAFGGQGVQDQRCGDQWR